MHGIARGRQIYMMQPAQMTAMKSMFFFNTAIGKIAIAEDGRAITSLCLPQDMPPAGAIVQKTGLLVEAEQQLHSYLSGRRRAFDLPLDPQGSEFMRAVWRSLQSIPYGQTRSYRDVAESLNNPRACRAVGAACRKNPIPVFIPCHRVISQDGNLTGYRGGLSVKEHLLKLEARI